MASQKKRKAEITGSLSEEERTPKKLKALEPDLIVDVGGIEFYHYKAILCSGCDFFDKIQSSEMKENGRIESSFQTKSRRIAGSVFFQ
jgi:hypothetical protein